MPDLIHRRGLPLLSALAMTLAPAGVPSAAEPVPATPEAAASAEPAATPEAPEATLAEVMVTARRRAESVLEIPISITALDAEDIEAAAVRDLTDVATLTSGLAYQPSGANVLGGRNSAQITFRGMNTTFAQPREQSGSLFVDGVYVSTSGISSINTVDVERIEVLKGPQNAYFGRNTFGGAVNFVTRNPGTVLRGEVNGEATSRGGHELNVSVEGPLRDERLAGRLSLLSSRRGAQYTALDGGEIGEERTNSVAATLYATPTDDLWMRLRAHYQQDEDGPYTSILVRGVEYGGLCPGERFDGAAADGAPTTFALALPYFCGAFPDLEAFGRGIVSVNTSLTPEVLQRIGRPTLYRDVLLANSLDNALLRKTPSLDHMGMRRDVLRVSAQSELALAGGLTLAFNLGYNRVATTVANDADRTNQENTFAVVPQLSDDHSLELRLQSARESRLRWLAGLNYFEIRSRQQQIGYQINTAFGGVLPTAAFVNPLTDDRATVPAAFAAVDIDLTDALTLTGELRYQEDRSSVAGAGGTRTGFTFESWLPRVIARFEPIEGSSLYASWSRGVMPGQLNGGFAVATPPQQQQILQQFPGAGTLAPLPEVDSYEVGFKQRAFEGRLQYAASVYYMQWANINTSVNVFVTGANNALVALSVVAPNDATLRGVEFEARALLTPSWEVGATANFQDNEYERFVNPTLGTLTGGVTRFDGNALPKSPSVTAGLSSTYRGSLGEAWQWFVRGDVFYTGKQWDSEANLFRFDAQRRANLRLGMESDALRVEAFVQNLFDDANWSYGYRTTSLGEPGALLQVPFNGRLTTVPGVAVQPPERREFGLRVQYRF